MKGLLCLTLLACIAATLALGTAEARWELPAPPHGPTLTTNLCADPLKSPRPILDTIDDCL